jgi:CRISPR/Cas system Type II protein with McrA/HNH and RuvC-like nuclease domain
MKNNDIYIKQELCLAHAAHKTHKAEIVLAHSRMYEGLLVASIMQKRVQEAKSQTLREEGEIQQLCADLRNRGIADKVDSQTMGPKELRDLFTDTEVRNFVSALDMTWIGGDEWSDSDADCEEDQCDGASWI